MVMQVECVVHFNNSGSMLFMSKMTWAEWRNKDVTVESEIKDGCLEIVKKTRGLVDLTCRQRAGWNMCKATESG